MQVTISQVVEDLEDDGELVLDLETGEFTIESGRQPDGCISAKNFDGVEKVLGVPRLRADAANNILTKLAPLAQRVLNGSTTTWRDSTLVGRLSSEGDAAWMDLYCELDDLIKDLSAVDVIEWWNPADYYAPLGSAEEVLKSVGLHSVATLKQVQAAAAREVARAEVELDVDEVIDYLNEAIELVREEEQ